jgi:hypothetical protein
MADINIQKKERPVWPWVLGILAVLALVFFLFRNNDGDDRRQAATTTTTRDTVDRRATDRTATGAGMGARTGAGAAGTEAREDMPRNVENFVEYVNENSARQEADLDHDYTADGIRRLARALDDLADRANMDGDDFDARKDRLKEQADAIQKNPQSLQHANIIRDAFTSAADMMESIQRQAYPNHGNQVSQVRQAANNINPNQQTMNQKGQIDTFFERSSQALQAMSTSPKNQGNMNRSNN